MDDTITCDAIRAEHIGEQVPSFFRVFACDEQYVG